MSEEKLQSSKVRRGLSIGLHLVIPFWAMRQTYRLAKNEVSRSKEHLEAVSYTHLTLPTILLV